MNSRVFLPFPLAAQVIAPLAATLALPMLAHGAVVYSGIQNLTVPATNDGLFLNVVTGLTGNTAASVPGWDLNPWSPTGFALFSPLNPAGGAYRITSPLTAGNLVPGTEIGPAATFGNSAATSPWVLNSANNLVGFRFWNEEGMDLHYGWFRVEFGATLNVRKIVEYAWESTPNSPIAAGNVIPEPSTPLLASLACALVLRRKRRCHPRG